MLKIVALLLATLMPAHVAEPQAIEPPPGPVTETLTIRNGTESGVAIHGTITSISTLTLTSTGTLTVASVGSSIAIPPRPHLMVYCSEDSCTAMSDSMERARDLLERIANREMKIDVVIDQNCTPRRETIPTRPEVVAAR